MIHEVSDIVASIAAAIEEQSTVTKDIARNIGEASTGVRDANTRVSETFASHAEHRQGDRRCRPGGREMAEGSDHVRTSAGGLSKLAEALQKTVSRFQVR